MLKQSPNSPDRYLKYPFKHKKRFSFCAVLAALSVMIVSCSDEKSVEDDIIDRPNLEREDPSEAMSTPVSKIANDGNVSPTECVTPGQKEVWIESGEFLMGSNDAYPEEAPVHPVELDGFWIDTHEVTNEQFAAFVASTGYVTVAEKKPDASLYPANAPADMLKPGSAVFVAPDRTDRQWWHYVPGADWRHPEGPGSSIDGKDGYPVVHVAYSDAKAYADWAGRALPTEAQFEFVARGGRKGEMYAWGGEDVAPKGEHQANTWQGMFPYMNKSEDGYTGLAPVGCFQPNPYGVYDMIGNVWEWTQDWYAPAHDTNHSNNPAGPTQSESNDRANSGFPVKVIKGGSFLCAPNFCMRYRPAARHAHDAGIGSNHIGFRTVSNRPKE